MYNHCACVSCLCSVKTLCQVKRSSTFRDSSTHQCQVKNSGPIRRPGSKASVVYSSELAWQLFYLTVGGRGKPKQISALLFSGWIIASDMNLFFFHVKLAYLFCYFCYFSCCITSQKCVLRDPRLLCCIFFKTIPEHCALRL